MNDEDFYESYVDSENTNETFDSFSETSLDDKAYKEVAKEVVAGHWGRGNARKKKLSKAGFDPNRVYTEVLKIFNQ